MSCREFHHGIESLDNVGGPASGYNSISVGAVGNYTYNDFSTVADFSSRGPQDYYDPVNGVIPGVRAPVDIVAPGTSMVVAFYGGQTGGNGLSLSTTTPNPSGGAKDWYTFGAAGTSYAAPLVTGGVALLKSTSYLIGAGDDWRNSLVIKAVLLNSATKLPGWDNGQHVDPTTGVTVTTQALDWSQGAGMLNLTNAFNEYLGATPDVSGTGGAIGTNGWSLGSISYSNNPLSLSHNDYQFTLTLQAFDVLDVTLCWFRNLSAPVFTDNADPNLQTLVTQDTGLANLDLQIWNSDFTTLFASSQTLYNDVQELHYTLPTDGQYGIRVIYAGQTFGTPQAKTTASHGMLPTFPNPAASRSLRSGCWWYSTAGKDFAGRGVFQRLVF